MPFRRGTWHEADDRIVIERPRPQGRGFRWLREAAAYAMATRRIRLDPIGSFAWKRFDGETTVREVVAQVQQEFGDAAEPVDERLGMFVRLLRTERLLGYTGID